MKARLVENYRDILSDTAENMVDLCNDYLIAMDRIEELENQVLELEDEITKLNLELYHE